MSITSDILARVEAAAEALVGLGTEYGGLFPSMVDLDGVAMLERAPDPIEGQRSGDRSYRGCNLIHDEATLLTLHGLAKGRSRPDFAAAADRYVRRYATHCTETPTGLFPWGEHAFWDLDTDAIGDSHRQRDPTREAGAIHDHLRAAPFWLWEKILQCNPACVQSFADGLHYHWTDGEPREYIRHATIEQRRAHPRSARSCDFPRHGGFFICDWAFAYRAEPRRRTLDEIESMLDYWWPKRDDRGLLQIESRTPEENDRFHDVNAPSQTLSLAISLLEAAPVLEASQADLAQRMRTRANAYVDAFFAAPHDLEEGVYVILSRRSTNELFQAMPVWGSVYGVWPASYVALTALLGFRHTQDTRLLEWAQSVGERYASEPLPSSVNVPAMDAGLGLGLLADLYELTSEPRWLDAALQLSARLLDVYFQRVLPAGASGIDWYESQMGPGFLLHGLARTALLSEYGTPCSLDGDYTAR
ncbi:MAG: hypothetical protein CME24_07115 [Gemmatimonadetes bacterium]|nr:hypothetical protein [Gemmatimonadota bacterium]